MKLVKKYLAVWQTIFCYSVMWSIWKGSILNLKKKKLWGHFSLCQRYKMQTTRSCKTRKENKKFKKSEHLNLRKFEKYLAALGSNSKVLCNSARLIKAIPFCLQKRSVAAQWKYIPYSHSFLKLVFWFCWTFIISHNKSQWFLAILIFSRK